MVKIYFCDEFELNIIKDFFAHDLRLIDSLEVDNVRSFRIGEYRNSYDQAGGAKCSGVGICIDDTDLWLLNKWKYFPFFEIKTCQIDMDGDTLEVYYHSFVGEAAEYIDISPSAFLSECRLKKCDIHLLIPCSASPDTFDCPNSRGHDVRYFMGQLKTTNELEFTSDFVKSLDREYIGDYYLTYDGRNYQPCAIICAKHSFTNLGVIDVIVSDVQVDALRILEEFRYKSLKIRDREVEKPISEWMQERKFVQYGEHRNLVFSYEKLSQNDIINVLATEYHPMGDIIGRTFIENAQENIAQYNTAEAYVSEVVLLEISTKDIPELTVRLQYQAIEVFFVELILLQDAAIGRVSAKVNRQIAQERDTQMASIASLSALVTEMSKSLLFFEPSNFVFPTVRRSAERISKRFGIDKAIDRYKQNKETLEQMINLAKIQRENKENTIINFILIMLTIVQVLPILANAIHFLIFKEIDIPELISEMAAFSICLIVCIQFYRMRRKFMTKL